MHKGIALHPDEFLQGETEKAEIHGEQYSENQKKSYQRIETTQRMIKRQRIKRYELYPLMSYHQLGMILT
ncbi:hypothetical protein L0Z72_08315 [candidate division KSB1 bacterium]|nr:hypothetical protein [candidate division KSB1 bacterium]